MIELRRTKCKNSQNFDSIVILSRGEPSGQYECHRYVEPAVNRQPGFRRGAVEQSAFNNTHNFLKLARSPDTRRANAGDVRGRWWVWEHWRGGGKGAWGGAWFKLARTTGDRTEWVGQRRGRAGQNRAHERQQQEAHVTNKTDGQQKDRWMNERINS